MTEFNRADYMTTGEAARFLAVSAETVRRWVKEGRVDAYVTPGGRHLVHRSEVERMQPQPAEHKEPIR